MSDMALKRVSVIGLGYIGLPTAAMFASRKIEVIGVDVDEETVETINNGEVHIVEPDLDIVVKSAVDAGLLKATTQPEKADAFLIAVPTPFKGDNHEPDLSYIEAASRDIAPMLEPGNLVILESTSPVGATEQMAEWLAEERSDLTFPQTHGEESDIRIAHCPERVMPGQVMKELIANDRVIGGMTRRCSERAVALYKTFAEGECVITNTRTAEMAKLTENSFRDVNIAFANELSMICDELDINVRELINLANRHPRVNILSPGPGVGGHCIAVDPWFIVGKTPDKAKIIRTARDVNNYKPEWVIKKIEAVCLQVAENLGVSPSDLTIGCLGLAFKANIDDLRESPALAIASRLTKLECGRVLACEPNILSAPQLLSGLELVDLESILNRADVLVGLVNHTEFRAFGKVNHPEKVFIDFAGVFERDRRQKTTMNMKKNTRAVAI